MLNYLWLNSQIPKSKAHGKIPEFLVQNLFKIRSLNPDVNFSFWHNPNHFNLYGQTQLASIAGEVITLCDINEHQEFVNCPLFRHEIVTESDQLYKWRQVDLAKVLVASITLSSSEQTFFSDLDIAHLIVDSPEVQAPMLKHGLIVGVGRLLKKVDFENQFFGFDQRNKGFLQKLLVRTLMATTIADGDNGYHALLSTLKREKKEILEEIAYYPNYCTQAVFHGP